MATPEPHPTRCPRLLGGAALVGMTVLAYLPALRAGFVWDDDFHVTLNHLLSTWAGLRSIWLEPGAMLQYYPLTHTTLWLEYHLWGVRPAGYHAVNVALHAANACLVWLLGRRLVLPGAWLVAAVFALHPVQVESVAWVTEIKNVQSGFFYLLAGLAFLRFALPADGERARPVYYAAALLLFLAALLSKTVTCTLPVSLLLCLWWKGGRVGRREIGLVLSMLALGAVAGGVTWWMEGSRVGAQGADYALSFVDRCLIAGRALWFYVAKLLLPMDLSFIYPRWRIDAGVWWQYAFPLGALATIGALWALRARLGRGPAAAALHFAATLGPALGFIDVFPMRYSFVADHYQYLASTGPIALAVGAACGMAARPMQTARAGLAAAVVVLADLGGATWQRTHVYQGMEALWRDTLRKNPAAWMAQSNLGVELLKQGRSAEATSYFLSALALRPNYLEALYNLGNVYAASTQWAEAAAYFERALAVDPNFAPAHNNLATAYANLGRIDEAIRHYERALEIVPDYRDARANLEAVRRGAVGPAR